MPQPRFGAYVYVYVGCHERCIGPGSAQVFDVSAVLGTAASLDLTIAVVISVRLPPEKTCTHSL